LLEEIRVTDKGHLRLMGSHESGCLLVALIVDLGDGIITKKTGGFF